MNDSGGLDSGARIGVRQSIEVEAGELPEDAVNSAFGECIARCGLRAECGEAEREGMAAGDSIEALRHDAVHAGASKQVERLLIRHLAKGNDVKEPLPFERQKPALPPGGAGINNL